MVKRLVQILGVDPAVMMTAMGNLAPVGALTALNMHVLAMVQNVSDVMMRRRAGPHVQRAGRHRVVRTLQVTMGVAVRLTAVVTVAMAVRNAVAVVDVVGLKAPSPPVVVPRVSNGVR